MVLIVKLAAGASRYIVVSINDSRGRGGSVLTDYLNAAMRRAEYQDLGDEGWYGHIPGLQGLWANAPTRPEAEQELRSALEEWVVFGLVNGYTFPPLDGIDLLSMKKPAA
jgi:predicted RNase H-like HicB family nuclease